MDATNAWTIDTYSRALEAWDGTPAAAHILRDNLTHVAQARAKQTDPVAQLVAKLKERKVRQLPVWLGGCDPHDRQRIVAALDPLLGDVQLAAWPHDDATTISDDDSILWCTFLLWNPIDLPRRYLVGPRLREFLLTMFRTRPRRTWIPAARLLGALASRDAAMREELRARWASFYPADALQLWSNSLGKRDPHSVAGKDNDDLQHMRRHLLVAACEFVAHGGDEALLGGSSPRAIALELKLTDKSDASTALTALGMLLRQPALHEGLAASACKRIATLPLDPQGVASLRDLVDHLAPSATPATLEMTRAALDRLQAPTWRDAHGQEGCDLLWCWLDTAIWLAGRGDARTLEQMRDTAAEAAPALALRLTDALPGHAADPAEALVPRLRKLLDPVTFDTTPDPWRAVLVAETLLLLDLTPVRGLPWGKLLERALGRPPAVAQGSVAAMARAYLALHLVDHGWELRTLLRDQRFEREAVLHLAGPDIDSGFVARQVAVQLERLLREARGPEAQLRLLWDFLHRDPHPEACRQLRLVLREGTGTVAELVEQVKLLDAIRDQAKHPAAGRKAPRHDQPLPAVEDAYPCLIQAAVRLLEGSSPPAGNAQPLEILLGLKSDLATLALVARPSVDSPLWDASLKTLLLGSTQGTGLIAWLRWLGAALPGLEEAWQAFELRLGVVRTAGDLAAVAHIEALDRAATALHGVLGAGHWPEGQFLATWLDDLDSWIPAQQSLATQRAQQLATNRAHANLETARETQASQRVNALLNSADEARIKIVASAGDRFSMPEDGELPEVPTLDWLPADDIRRIHRFLLAHMQFDTADALRTHAGARTRQPVELPSRWAYLMPLVGGLVSGPLIVLDIGGSWNDLLTKGQWAVYGLTVALALVASYALLAGTLVARTSGHGGKPGARDLARLTRRIFSREVLVRVRGVYGRAWLTSFAAGSVVLLTLYGTDVWVTAPPGVPQWEIFGLQAMLWGSLSLLLGLFLGLVVQGRALLADE